MLEFIQLNLLNLILHEKRYRLFSNQYRSPSRGTVVASGCSVKLTLGDVFGGSLDAGFGWRNVVHPEEVLHGVAVQSVAQDEHWYRLAEVGYLHAQVIGACAVLLYKTDECFGSVYLHGSVWQIVALHDGNAAALFAELYIGVHGDEFSVHIPASRVGVNHLLVSF